MNQNAKAARSGTPRCRMCRPPSTYLFTDFVPMLKMLKARGWSDHKLDAILHDDPCRSPRIKGA